jgi:cytochrome c5
MRRHLRPVAALVAALGVLAAVATAQETELRDAPGRELVVSRCAVCHSLDYITMNSPFLDHAGWEKSVRKMIDVMGAPVEEKDVAKIVDYLAREYGK